MHRIQPASIALATLSSVLLVAPATRAQVNSDVGLSAGVMKRFTTGADQGVSNPGFGPVVQLQGHLAVIPMFRAGLYVAYDRSPLPHAGTRNYVTGGLHLKFAPPLLPTPWKLYFFTGFGGGFAEADGYSASIGTTNGVQTTGTANVQVSSIDGGLLEIPLGVGISRKLGSSWELFAELGGRFGVAFFGQMYDSQNTATFNAPPGLPSGSSVDSTSASFTGIDSFALSLSVGVSLSD